MPIRYAPDALVFKADFSGFQPLVDSFRELPQAIQNRIGRQATLAAARIVAASAKELVPVMTGELRKAIKARQATKLRQGLTAATAGVHGPEGPLAHIIELGAVPHAILPVKRTVMKLVVNGEVRFFTKVSHPGYVRTTPFLRNALANNAKAAAEKIVNTTLAGIDREMQKPETIAKAARDRARARLSVRS
jgi:HK97 gp10 family phage protein